MSSTPVVFVCSVSRTIHEDCSHSRSCHHKAFEIVNKTHTRFSLLLHGLAPHTCTLIGYVIFPFVLGDWIQKLRTYIPLVQSSPSRVSLSIRPLVLGSTYWSLIVRHGGRFSIQLHRASKHSCFILCRGQSLQRVFGGVLRGCEHRQTQERGECKLGETTNFESTIKNLTPSLTNLAEV